MKDKLIGHFMCGVIIPKDTEDIERTAERLLIPFYHFDDDYDLQTKLKANNIDNWPRPRLWWEIIGGLYNGEIQGRTMIPASINFDYNHPDLKKSENNVSSVDEVIKNKIRCSAYVTPDGKWHQRGGDGINFVVQYSDDHDVWDKERWIMLKKYHGYQIVGFHCYEEDESEYHCCLPKEYWEQKVFLDLSEQDVAIQSVLNNCA